MFVPAAGLAARQYERCQSILAEELAIAPIAETQALCWQLCHRSPPIPHPSHPWPGEGLREAIHHIEIAVRSFEQAKEQLHQAIQLLGHHLPAEMERLLVVRAAESMRPANTSDVGRLPLPIQLAKSGEVSRL